MAEHVVTYEDLTGELIAGAGGGVIGDVSGPASSTDEAVARFDGTTGKQLQNSVVILSDLGVFTGIASVDGGIVFNEPGADVDFRVEGDSLTHMLFLDASAATENIALVAAAAPNWQTMDRGLFLGDASTVPTGNPASGVFIYSEAGVLKSRDPGGTVTSLAPSGSVQGPAVAVDNAVARFDGTTGKLIQNSVVIVSDTGVVSGVPSIEGGFILNNTNADVDFRVAGDTLTHLFFADASAATENLALIATGAPNWQSMDGGLFLGDATTVPTGNPASGVFIYSEASVLKSRDSAGTVTTIAPNGSVVGPAVATDNALARFDGTTGKLIQNSVITAGDTGIVSGIASIEGGTILNNTNADVDFRVAGDTLTHLFFADASAATENLALIATGAPNWQSMDGGLFLGNATTAPTGNPTSGIFLYAEGGELKVRDSAGNISIVSNLGTMAAQNANAVAITGGTIHATEIGDTVNAALTNQGTFTFVYIVDETTLDIFRIMRLDDSHLFIGGGQAEDVQYELSAGSLTTTPTTFNLTNAANSDSLTFRNDGGYLNLVGSPNDGIRVYQVGSPLLTNRENAFLAWSSNEFVIDCQANGTGVQRAVRLGHMSGTTGANAVVIGTNSPATAASQPYTWIRAKALDGSDVFIPAWK